jgi:hypothetical protein
MDVFSRRRFLFLPVVCHLHNIIYMIWIRYDR